MSPKLVAEHTIAADKNGMGAAFELLAGQRIRIFGKQTVDFVAFNLHNLSERFDQARSRTNQLKIFLSVGDVLFSKDNNAMLTIMADRLPSQGPASPVRINSASSGSRGRAATSASPASWPPGPGPGSDGAVAGSLGAGAASKSPKGYPEPLV